RRWWLVGGVALGSLVAAAVLVVRFWPQPSTRAGAVAAEARAQFKLPAQLDAITRLDTIEADGNTIVYRYTLSGTDPAIAKKLQEGLDKVVCTKPELKQLMAQGLGLEYRYRLSDATMLPSFTYSAATCAGR